MTTEFAITFVGAFLGLAAAGAGFVWWISQPFEHEDEQLDLLARPQQFPPRQDHELAGTPR